MRLLFSSRIAPGRSSGAGMRGLRSWCSRIRRMTYKRTWQKNRRKAAILGILARAQGPLTYVQVAGSLGLYPARQVARDLQRYVTFGYARRGKMAGKFRYEITRR